MVSSVSDFSKFFDSLDSSCTLSYSSDDWVGIIAQGLGYEHFFSGGVSRWLFTVYGNFKKLTAFEFTNNPTYFMVLS